MSEELLDSVEEIIVDRYYYKDSDGNYYSFKKQRDGLIAITEQEFNEYAQSLSKSVTPSQTSYTREQILAKRRIEELKQFLFDTDYQAIKYAEGLISAQDYEPIKQLRQSYRDEINQLESEV